MEDDFTAQVSGVGALADPARRALYGYVVGQHAPVSRDAAAELSREVVLHRPSSHR